MLKKNSKSRLLTFAQATNEAIDQAMARDQSVFVIGEGVPDPKNIFGTTAGLQKKYGSSRVMDMPVSENGLTGVCIGAALRGMRPILTHQRVDFSLLSADQLINNAAKWFFMFGGQQSVPLVIRMIVGRGWGQGAQHSQSLQAIYAHIPGLKVIMPTTASDAKGLLISAIEDNNPVISLEHRWLFNLTNHVPKQYFKIPIGKARVMHKGTDVTVVACSYASIEAYEVAQVLKKTGISIEVVDLRTIRPLDRDLINKSVNKTGRLLVVDTGWTTGGITAEVITQVVERSFSKLKSAPRRLALPDIPTPSAPALTKNFYPTKIDIAREIFALLGKKMPDLSQLFPPSKTPHDVPDETFKGPF